MLGAAQMTPRHQHFSHKEAKAISARPQVFSGNPNTLQKVKVKERSSVGESRYHHNATGFHERPCVDMKPFAT
jgi:hypothetical protein